MWITTFWTLHFLVIKRQCQAHMYISIVNLIFSTFTQISEIKIFGSQCVSRNKHTFDELTTQDGQNVKDLCTKATKMVRRENKMPRPA